MKRQILVSLILLSLIMSKLSAQTPDVDFTARNITLHGGLTDLGNTNLRTSILNFISTNGSNNWESGFIAGIVGNPGDIMGYPGGLSFYTKAKDGNYSSTSIERMRISYNGNIGIGTTLPQVKLHIESNNNENSTGYFGATGSGTAGIYFDASNGDFIGMDYGCLLQKNDLSIELGNAGAYPLNFKTADITRMSINGAGQIGIGTSAPGNGIKLDVIGTIRAREIKVDLNGADFVFDKDYKLMPLSELEKFVKEQKHLPEIASAKEMKENGTELGDLNSKLLQKIEELTLYTIEQNKELQKLKEEIEQLKAASK